MKNYPLEELCLEIIDQCPLKCLHCSSNSSPAKQEKLSFKLIKKILKDFKELGGKRLELSGGEPLLHKKIDKIVKYAKQEAKIAEVYLYTTGLSHAQSPSFSAARKNILKLKESVDKFLFGLHGAKDSTHEKITTQKGSFTETLKVIKWLKKEGALVGIHFVPLKINYGEIEALLKITAKLKVDEVAVLRFVPQGRGRQNKKSLSLKHDEVKELLKTMAKLKRKYESFRLGCPTDFTFLLGNSKVRKCKIGQNTLAIRPDGGVSLCPAFKYKKIVGQVKEKGLKEIWYQSPILRQIRKLNQKDFDTCGSCDHFYLCQGRCLAQHLYHSGEIFKGQDPWCSTAKSLLKAEG